MEQGNQQEATKKGEIVKVYVNSQTHEGLLKQGWYAYGKVVTGGLFLTLEPLEGEQKAKHYRELDAVNWTAPYKILTRRYNRNRFNN
jgi:hypothetical protein